MQDSPEDKVPNKRNFGGELALRKALKGKEKSEQHSGIRIAHERSGGVTGFSPAPEMIMCGNGNSALFGKCLASAGTGLELHLSSAKPVYPDLTFPVSVRKLDHYNQTVASDSTTFVQIRSEMAIDPVANRSFPSIAAVLSGTTVLVLREGKAVVSVALRPAIVNLSDLSGSTQLGGDAFIYGNGVDSETSVSLRFVPCWIFIRQAIVICLEFRPFKSLEIFRVHALVDCLQQIGSNTCSDQQWIPNLPKGIHFIAGHVHGYKPWWHRASSIRKLYLLRGWHILNRSPIREWLVE